MQYILSQEEFDDLNAKQRSSLKLSEKKLQTLCTKIANEMPICLNWGPWKDEPTPWGCILTEEPEWYCDSCPVLSICPNRNKEFSK